MNVADMRSVWTAAYVHWFSSVGVFVGTDYLFWAAVLPAVVVGTTPVRIFYTGDARGLRDLLPGAFPDPSARNRY